MSDPIYLQKKYQTTNEPKVHPLIKGSIVFVPSAGMRLAPETLVLELMREVFFDIHSAGSAKAQDLTPDELDVDGRPKYSDREKAVLYALQGRRKKTKTSRDQKYFAPAYPHLAKNAWMRKSSERVVNNFLFEGPLAQYIWRNKNFGHEKRVECQQNLTEIIVKALIGGKSCLDKTFNGTDILAATLGPETFDQDMEAAKDKIVQLTKSNPQLLVDDDELANQIANDLIAICELESKLPRMQWLQLLMTFLRFALPMWLLSRMKIISLVYQWVLDAADLGVIVDDAAIRECISNRNRGLLHPTLTPTRELYEHIDRYMKCRVELDILLCYSLNEVGKRELSGKKKLSFDGEKSKETLPFDELLTYIRDATQNIQNMDYFKEIADGQQLKIGTFLTREGQHFLAWRNPRGAGVGKNIDEFFRVLYRAEVGDEAGGHLLTPEGIGAKRGFRVFPGQLLLKTVTYLAAHKKGSGRKGGSGILVLQDVEDHFGIYGVDFSTAADARPLLMNQLQAMGLLRGSPDAGSSVTVAIPY